MDTITISIVDLIQSPSALTREQGKIIYDKIIDYIQDGTKVLIDFTDIESLITPFLNVAIGKLYENYSSEQLKSLIEFINIPKGTSSKFQLVIDNAKQYYANKDIFKDAVRDVIKD